jgi:hypothetical protein
MLPAAFCHSAAGVPLRQDFRYQDSRYDVSVRTHAAGAGDDRNAVLEI